MSAFFNISEILGTDKLRQVIRLGLVFFSLALGLRAEEAKERPYVSEEISEQLGKIGPLFEKREWDQAMEIINKMYPKAKPESYDQAVLLNLKVNVYLNKNEYAKAIPCMEEGLHISRKNGYLESKAEIELTYLLAQLYYSEGVTPGRKAAEQREYFFKAMSHMERWDQLSSKPSADALQFYGSLAYNIAQSYGESAANKEAKAKYVKQAQVLANRGVQSVIRPKESFYMLLVACAQELGDYAQMSEYLELLVTQYPANSTYWQQLVGTYVNLAAAEKLEKDALPFNIRAILALERAQAAGHMTTNKDRFSLFSLYFNIQQFAKAAELMEAGLKSGEMDDEQRNWEMLSYCYQQVNKELKSVEVLKKAASHFPKSGQLYLQVANNYYMLDKVTEAYENAKLSVQKGGLDQPYKAHYFIAFLAFEMRKFDEALVAIDKAIAMMPTDKPEAQYPQLREAINAGIEDQKRIRTAVENQRKIR